jgi:hypothetical protein
VLAAPVRGADEQKADYPSIRVRPDYIKRQDVATTQDVKELEPLG